MSVKLEDHSTRPHAKLGASSMHRWSICPGSINLSEGIHVKSSTYAEEGTYAHEFAADILMNKRTIHDLKDLEIEEPVLEYINFVKSLESIHTDVLIEHRFDLSHLYPDMYGTSDAVIYDRKKKKLYVIDYKHGAGIAVDAINNKQLQFYALGSLYALKKPCETVEMIIVQPRCFHKDGTIRRWEVSVTDLIEFEDDLIKAALRTKEEPNTLVVGDHCRFCPAASICPKMKEVAHQQAMQIFSKVTKYDVRELSKTLEMLDVLEGWIKDVRSFAMQEAEDGVEIPGFKLVQKRATRKWIDEVKAHDALSKILHDEQIFEKKFKSVAQIEKNLGKEQKSILENLVVAESSGLTLVSSNDKREAVQVIPFEGFSKID